jgi:hypothetical protein
MPLNRCRAAAFPCNAHGTRLIADRLGALRRDDILVTACDHIESDVEPANAMRQATQGVNRRSMAGNRGSGRVANSRR